MRIIGGYQDTRTNQEDFAITPYLFGVWLNASIIKIAGLGICWGYASIFIGVGKGIPKHYPTFNVLKNKSQP